MDKEELIVKLQMVYVGDINALNELIGYYDGLKEVIGMVQQENKLLKDKYTQRERKWEKWNTEKSILSSKMSEYLCKYQNIKREYKNQNDCLCKYKAENNQLQEVIEEVREYIRDSYVEVLKYYDEPSETTSYEIVTVDLLQILDKGSDK